MEHQREIEDRLQKNFVDPLEGNGEVEPPPILEGLFFALSIILFVLVIVSCRATVRGLFALKATAFLCSALVDVLPFITDITNFFWFYPKQSTSQV